MMFTEASRPLVKGLNVLIVGYAALLMGCGGGGGGGGGAPAQPPAPEHNPADISIQSMPNNMHYPSGISMAQVAALNETISSIYKEPLTSVEPDLMRMMRVTDLEPATVQRWLEDRVQYIVPENFDTDSNLVEYTTQFAYPNPTLIPDPANPPATTPAVDPNATPAPAAPHPPVTQSPPEYMPQFDAANPTAHVVMKNEGARIYLIGKMNNVLLGLQIPGIGVVKMTSPRVGILQIGSGMFPAASVQNIAADIFRAGILVHEARHSDGNGYSIGFLHTNCPKGHDFEGLPACDFAANGAYTVGAKFMKSMMDSCTDCTPRSLEMLKLMYLDQADRVVEGSVDLPGHKPEQFVATPTEWDDLPEGSR